MNRKWTVFYISPGDYKGAEDYLNRQAAKGWELEKMAGAIACWRKTERPSRWCVDLLNGRADRAEKLDYLDLCAEGGWTLVALRGMVAIFRAEPGREPFPIQTDPELEKKNYNRYYLRPAILSVVYILAMLAAAVWSVSARNFGAEHIIKELTHGWLEQWTVAALYLVLPVWGLMALWKIICFAASLVRNRRRITAPTPAAMWIHSVLVLASLVLGVLVLVAMAVDKVLGNTDNLYLFFLLGMYAIALLYRAFAMERQLFRGERRRHVAAGILCLVLLAGLIAADVTLPYKEWYTAWYSSDREEAMEVYGETFALPLVHGEDVGISFDGSMGDDGAESVEIVHTRGPMGDSWELQYHYNREKATYGDMGVGTVMVHSPSLRMAGRTAAALADGMDRSGHDLWPEEAPTPVALDWADEAWHCRFPINGEGGTADVLVVRVGTRVARMVLPADLLAEENLAAIRAEMER